jgi:glycosyltransferase involved in cell wall biosynthesis
VEGRDKFVLGYVGRNAPRKMLMTILDTYVTWTKDKPDTALFVHSPDTDEQGVFQMALSDLYPDANVIFSNAVPGDQPDDLINKFYNYFDVILNRSFNEGFGMPVGEAMLAGTPCISIDTPGPAGIITPETGWLVKGDLHLEGDAVVPYIYARYAPHDKWEAALDQAYYNRDLLKQKAQKCRQHILDNYTVENMCTRLEESILKAVKEFKPYPNFTVTTYPKVKEETNV